MFKDFSVNLPFPSSGNLVTIVSKTSLYPHFPTAKFKKFSPNVFVALNIFKDFSVNLPFPSSGNLLIIVSKTSLEPSILTANIKTVL